MQNLKFKSYLLLIISVTLMLVITNSCGMLNTPAGWQQGANNDAGWSAIPLSDDVSYDLAWDDIISMISRQFEIEMLSKEAGYIRTKWQNNWMSDGTQMKNYRVRVTLKLSEHRKKVEINSEAELLRNGQWIRGTDTELLRTIKQDVSGLVGS